jgi:hypothetical protein
VTSRRITLFAGHYGSGKTNIALNFARAVKPCVVADLDIVNPYFRTKDSAAALAAEGIGLVVSDYANSNVDFPAMPKETYALVADRTTRVVIDVGGDDRGALALGRYVDDIRAESDYDMLAVINASRPLTVTPDDTIEVLREIEAACRLPFTGLVNNTNLGQQTTVQTILDSIPYADEIARRLNVPVRFTTCRADLKDALAAQTPADFPIFPLTIQKLYYQLEV